MSVPLICGILDKVGFDGTQHVLETRWDGGISKTAIENGF